MNENFVLIALLMPQYDALAHYRAKDEPTAKCRYGIVHEFLMIAI